MHRITPFLPMFVTTEYDVLEEAQMALISAVIGTGIACVALVAAGLIRIVETRRQAAREPHA
jgi:hypothetical protein